MTSWVKCPTCSTDVEWSAKSAYRPFCCERCRLIDLGDWASGNHSIPGRSGEAEWSNNISNAGVDGDTLN